MELSEAYHQLSYYTLNHPEPDRFVHQHIVDAQTAHTAQTASADDRPISLLYALFGLYLAVVRGRMADLQREPCRNRGLLQQAAPLGLVDGQGLPSPVTGIDIVSICI